MKSIYPGDSEFSLENYSSLPWAYVASAVSRGMAERHKHLHDYERPVALQSSMVANQNRDPKKQQQAYTYLDFSFYKPVGDGETPQEYNGSAYMELIRSKRMPHWALFCFKSFSGSAAEGYVPDEAGFVAEDAILVHPERTAGGWKGLLIAQESAGDQYRIFTDSKGNALKLRVPYVDTKVIAREGEVLTL